MTRRARFARVGVVTTEWPVFAQTGRTEEDDGIVHAFAPEASERLEVLGENADRAAFGALEKGFVSVGQRCTALVREGHDGWPLSVRGRVPRFRDLRLTGDEHRTHAMVDYFGRGRSDQAVDAGVPVGADDDEIGSNALCRLADGFPG